MLYRDSKQSSKSLLWKTEELLMTTAPINEDKEPRENEEQADKEESLFVEEEEEEDMDEEDLSDEEKPATPESEA